MNINKLKISEIELENKINKKKKKCETKASGSKYRMKFTCKIASSQEEDVITKYKKKQQIKYPTYL